MMVVRGVLAKLALNIARFAGIRILVRNRHIIANHRGVHSVAKLVLDAVGAL